MIQNELDRLRLELRDRDMEIISLRAQIKLMRNCDNCNNWQPMPDGTHECFLHTTCGLPTLKAWEAKE
jgi:hypothetical protein